jgi:predicted ATPase
MLGVVSEHVSRRVMGVSKIADDFYRDGCKKAVESAAVCTSIAEKTILVIWLCREHGLTFKLDDSTPDAKVHVQEARTCLYGVDTKTEMLCGAYATHVAVIENRFDDGREPNIHLTSCCKRHTGNLGVGDDPKT